tara:strand:- start:314 stop:463 length:150 start_codon:yes stop_codon:yes gene_type:complete
MSNVKEVTNSLEDWDDFWYSPELYDEWTIDDFEEIWQQMDEIEPLTPKK